MAKVPKLANKSTSLRSRASRRAPSPAIDDAQSTGKVDTFGAAREPVPAILAAHQGSKVSKNRKEKPLTRKQRLRKEKSSQKAAAISDRLGAKVGKSKTKGKVIKDRSADWEELNAVPGARKVIKQKVPLKSSLPIHDPMDSTLEPFNSEAAIGEGSLSQQPTVKPDLTQSLEDIDLIS